ncbi:conserved hypothetical protein [Burkholderia pseudomallei Pakistan 9]|nr:conserved hypothetical protein [Burkholderia pseudomallei Pakistan 9]
MTWRAPAATAFSGGRRQWAAGGCRMVANGGGWPVGGRLSTGG